MVIDYTPTYGVTGYSTQVETITLYTRSLTLVAYDAKSLKKQYWRVIAVSAGTTGNLRVIFPYLVTASQPYFGKNTNKEAVTIAIKTEDDDNANFIWIRDGKVIESDDDWLEKVFNKKE